MDEKRLTKKNLIGPLMPKSIPATLLSLLFLISGISNAATPQTDSPQPASDSHQNRPLRNTEPQTKPKEVNRKLAKLRVNPINIALGGLGADIEVKVLERLTLGPTYSSYDFTFDRYGVKATTYGVRAYWYGRGAFNDSSYISPLFQTGSVEITDGDFKGSVDLTNYGIMFGYQWIWENFHINTGTGYSTYLLKDPVLKDSAGNTMIKKKGDLPFSFSLMAEFSMGWAF